MPSERSDGVFGARMTGGGFGGCAVALVDAARATASARAEAGTPRIRRRQASAWIPHVCVTRSAAEQRTSNRVVLFGFRGGFAHA